MKAGAMIALARACNVSLDWLAEGQDRADNSFEVAKTVPSEDMMTVKYFHVEPTAGRGAVPSDFEGYESINLSREFLKNVLGIYSNDIFFLRVQGDSMQPSINPGETLLVDFKPDSLTQSIYVISVQGLLMVKRLSIKDPQTFKVVSDNPRYDAFDVPINRVCWGNADVDNADMRIIGRVVGRFQLGI